MSDLRPAAETAVRKCMRLGGTESCLIVTDDDRQPIGEALYEVASEDGEDAAIITYPPGDQHGEEPPESVAAAMAAADVVLAPTTKSLSHTQARSDANEAGARVATLPGITEDVFVEGLDADYSAIEGHCEEIYEQVHDAEEVRVQTERGTDILFQSGDREWRQDTGIVHEAGQMSNLPAGEVFVSPETADGTVVVGGTMMPHGLLDADNTITYEVEDGTVTSIDDAALREQIEDAAAEAGDAASNLAELGIGTNVGVTELMGSVLADEKAAGTVHIAVGDDHAIGGDTEAPIHLDGVLRDPTVTVDGTEIALPEP